MLCLGSSPRVTVIVVFCSRVLRTKVAWEGARARQMDCARHGKMGTLQALTWAPKCKRSRVVVPARLPITCTRRGGGWRSLKRLLPEKDSPFPSPLWKNRTHSIITAFRVPLPHPLPTAPGM